MARKSDLIDATIRVRPPAYLSCASLARELDVSESTVRELVKQGIIPGPVSLTAGCVRWEWERVQRSLSGATVRTEVFAVGAGESIQTQDAYITGAINAARKR